MTNGTVVVLGRTGRNFGAGMTGGTAFVLDLDDTFEGLYNPQLVRLERLGTEEDESRVKELIYKHLEATDSAGQGNPGGVGRFVGKFWKVCPLPPAATKPGGRGGQVTGRRRCLRPATEVMAAAKP